ncbi:hypothetical protein ACPYO6_02550 [Georgenia sp. Z1344]|uniref:hypothetical protein n=1 Tax=Georgenia sp. Z1344 TaxID=3416706 RepID=UPI003CEA9AC0
MTTYPEEPGDDERTSVGPPSAGNDHGREPGPGTSPEDPDDENPSDDRSPSGAGRPDGANTSGAGELDDAEVDRRFASILDQLGAAPVRSPAPPATDDRPARTPRPLGPRDELLEEHPEDPAWGIDGFVEPDPPGPDLSDPGAVVGWLLAIGPIVAGIVLGLVGRPPSVLIMLLGLAVTIGGITLLVRRLPGERGHGSDGAVV